MEKKNYLKPEMKVFDMKVEGTLLDSSDSTGRAKGNSWYDDEDF